MLTISSYSYPKQYTGLIAIITEISLKNIKCQYFEKLFRFWNFYIL